MEEKRQHKFMDEWLAKALLEHQIINEAYLDKMRIKHSNIQYLSDVLIRTNQLKPTDIAEFVESILQVPFVNLDKIGVNTKAVEKLKEDTCLKYKVFPFDLSDHYITVAFSNPFDLAAEREVLSATGKSIKAFFAFGENVENKIAEFYSPKKIIDKIVDGENSNKAVKIISEKTANSESPVTKLVSRVIGDAISKEASFVQIEPDEKRVLVRYRIDGVLKTILEMPKSVQPSFIKRIKVISNLDTAEFRRPQHGKGKVQYEGGIIHLGMSVLPTRFGEKAVIHILDGRYAKVSFQQLGLRGKNLELLEKCFTKTQGMVLITGPTDSGKTTSLYAALNHIKKQTDSILTIEDPIEFMLDGINQLQVDQQAGITFVSGLRSILQQNSDIIMVGEIRDKEVAEISLEAALTGHLVLTALHTNDSLEAITRLRDMGLDIQKIASSVKAVVGQRLLKTLCPKCKSEKEPDKTEQKLIPIMTRMGYKPKFYTATGCPSCDHTGYSGRVGVYEILRIDKKLKDLIGVGESMTLVRKIARIKGFESLYENAVKHIAEGMTDYKEVLRVIDPYSTDGVSVFGSKPQSKPVTVVKPDWSDKLSISRSTGALKLKADQPEKPPVAKAKAAMKATGKQGLSEKRATILMVEDDFDIRRQARTLIEKKTNWRCFEAEDGVRGLELVAKSKPDIIVVDIMMPQMSGYEFLMRLKDSRSTAAIPVLLLTALDSEDFDLVGLDLGADDYLTKPYKNDVLLTRIKRLLDRSKNLAKAGVFPDNGSKNLN